MHNVEGFAIDILKEVLGIRLDLPKKLVKFLSLIFGSDINFKDLDSLVLEKR